MVSEPKYHSKKGSTWPKMTQCSKCSAVRSAPEAVDLIGNLLDSDGDGSVTDDLAKLGGGLLGGLFGK